MLCGIGRTEILKDFRKDSCIASTRVAIDVLNHFHISAKPIATALTVFNPTYARNIHNAGYIPTSPDEIKEWFEQGARSVEINSQDLAHVVAIIKNAYLLDLSLDQANRPHKKIHVSPHCSPIPKAFVCGETAEYSVGGCIICYHALPENKNFIHSRDWLYSDRTRRAIHSIISQIQKRLDKIVNLE